MFKHQRRIVTNYLQFSNELETDLECTQCKINKKKFNKIINELKELNYLKINKKDQDDYEQKLNYLILVIKKNIKNYWYLEKYLEIFFFNNIIIGFKNSLNFLPLFKIKNILQKYKLSKIIKLFYKKIKLKPKKTCSDLNSWFKIKINNQIMYNNIKGLSFLMSYLIKDKIVKNEFIKCKTATQQLLYIAFNYGYCVSIFEQ